MAKTSRPTAQKRAREKAQQERQKEKQQRRAEARERKANAPVATGDEDPDLAGMRPGPAAVRQFRRDLTARAWLDRTCAGSASRRGRRTGDAATRRPPDAAA